MQATCQAAEPYPHLAELELIAVQVVLQGFGFFMDFIPAQLERFEQEGFQKPVAPDDIQGVFSSGSGQPGPLVLRIETAVTAALAR